MSSANKLLLIGIACVIFGALCLLIVHFEHAHAKSTEKPALNVVASSTSSASAGAASASTTTLASPNAQLDSSGQHVVSTSGMQIETVTTVAAQNRGLGGRAVIPDNYAMLFVFPQDGEPGFWMKDMLTSIDMIWLTDNGTIVSINPSVAADTYPEAFYPPVPIKYVLETKADFATEHGWTVGTRVELPAPYGE